MVTMTGHGLDSTLNWALVGIACGTGFAWLVFAPLLWRLRGQPKQQRLIARALARAPLMFASAWLVAQLLRWLFDRGL